MLPVAQAADTVVARAPAVFPTREHIVRLQSAMVPIQSEQPEPEHIFHDGWYERRLLVPAGMLIVGKTHRHLHTVGVIRGHAMLISEFGRDEVRGGYLSASQPGVKRIVFAFEDTLFVTVHRNRSNTRDLARIEAEHIEPERLVALGDADAQQVLQ
jgi:hypothetical protein